MPEPTQHAENVRCVRCGKAYLPHDLDGMGECENCIPADEAAFASDLAKLDLERLLDEDDPARSDGRDDA